MKKNQGITLIALIITIIIMLILVAVTIDVVVDGKLFDTAKDAVDKTNDKVGETQDRVDGLMNELDEVYEWQENQGSNEHNWQYTDNTLASLKCTCNECKGRIVYIGQEMKYTDGGTNSTTISGEKSGISQAILDEPEYYKAEDYGPNGEQTIGKDSNMKWVVFGAEDTDKNGTNETLLITTLEPTSDVIELFGTAGYNNGIEELNRICRELYGENARSITIEDVNRTLGYTPAGGMYSNEYNYQTEYQTTGNFTTKLKDLSVWEDIKASGTYTPDGANTEEILGEYILDGYSYVIKEGWEETGQPWISERVSNVAKNMIFGPSNNVRYHYWLASRGITVYTYEDSSGASFGMGAMLSPDVAYYELLTSEGFFGSTDLSIRVIVPLRADIPEEGEILVNDYEWGLP